MASDSCRTNLSSPLTLLSVTALMLARLEAITWPILTHLWQSPGLSSQPVVECNEVFLLLLVTFYEQNTLIGSQGTLIGSQGTVKCPSNRRTESDMIQMLIHINLFLTTQWNMITMIRVCVCVTERERHTQREKDR